MAELLTKRGDRLLVDDEDFIRLSATAWRIDGAGYPGRRIKVDGAYADQLLHRVVLGLRFGDGLVVDHINGNKLDNRKVNLRVCTQAENARNRGITRRNTSGLKGVCWHKHKQRWYSTITVSRVRRCLGYFKTPSEAYEAYVKAAKALHGEFANTGV